MEFDEIVIIHHKRGKKDDKYQILQKNTCVYEKITNEHSLDNKYQTKKTQPWTIGNMP